MQQSNTANKLPTWAKVALYQRKWAMAQAKMQISCEFGVLANTFEVYPAITDMAIRQSHSIKTQHLIS